MGNNRFTDPSFAGLEDANRNPIFGYEDSPLLTLEEAVENIMPPVPHLMNSVATAKKKCNQHSSLLTGDESAALYLYSMPTPFFFSLNETLRAGKRHALKPWFVFLKLFMTALDKLPSIKCTVWRGVDYDDTLTFVDDDVHIWWGVNSCSLAPQVVQPYLGEKGTLFAIDVVHGKNITEFSAMPDEQEVVLMPGTRMRRRGDSVDFNDHFLLQLEESSTLSAPLSDPNYLVELVKDKYRRNNRIERLVNPAKSFPIERSYINLSIVKAKEQRDKEKQLRDAQHSGAILSAFEEIYGMKTTIDVKNMFDTCENEEKQVLVFGRAGIGKSTFCRFIAYQWAKGSYWSQYELLALIPLRRLTDNRYPLLSPGQSYSLIDLLKKEVFQYDLSEKETMFLKEHFDPKKTLWILDGYDEIVQNVPSHLECLFEQLLHTPHHIITSRPYLNTLSYDVQMEITGFTDENIVKYVQQFFDQMKDELDDTSAESQRLFNFLTSNPSAWGVAHIPVNLELICSAWSDEDWSEREQLTIAALYSTITEWLCRRYLTPKNKPTLQLSKDQIDQRCHKELAFLESLAFHAMESSTIIIPPTLLQKAIKEANVSLQDHPHILNLGVLKSLNKRGTGTQIEVEKDHYFVHLSFQEYFAAQYLTKALAGSSNAAAIAFIQRQKYNRRFRLVFTFATGLLSESGDKANVNIFWNTMLGDPLDVVGIRHMQLVIACLEETVDKSIVPGCTKLFEWIAQCIQYSSSTEGEFIRQHLTQSLEKAQTVACDRTIINVLIKLLQDDNSDSKYRAPEFVRYLELSNPPAALLDPIILMLEDMSNDVRCYASLTLMYMSEKAVTDEVISRLVSNLEGERNRVRSTASLVLGRMGEKALTNEVISRLINALRDERDCVRKSACEALGWIGTKAANNEVIPRLVSALGDDSEHVRKSACEALDRFGETAATKEVIEKLANALRDEKDSVGESASRALGRMGEKAATNEVISKLVDMLEDAKESVRFRACRVLVKIGDKSAINEAISRLVSALEDERESVRYSACCTLGEMREKAATNEVISKLLNMLKNAENSVRSMAYKTLAEIGDKAAINGAISRLVSALEDERESVRYSACCTLGEMGEKAATNEVISKLLNALGDVSEIIRYGACTALGLMGEKAATNEVISKLLVLTKSGDPFTLLPSSDAVKNILRSSTTIDYLDSKTITDLCLFECYVDCLTNISEDRLFNLFSTAENIYSVLVLGKLILRKEIAVTVMKDKFVIIGEKEPSEFPFQGLELCARSVKILTDQAKQLHLFFGMPREMSDQSSIFSRFVDVLCFCYQVLLKCVRFFSLMSY